MPRDPCFSPDSAKIIKMNEGVKRLCIRVLNAKGHGPNALFPHEQAWCELWVEGEVFHEHCTERYPSKGEVCFNESFEFLVQGDALVLHLGLRGRLSSPQHQGVDVIGTGVCRIDMVRLGSSCAISMVESQRWSSVLQAAPGGRRTVHMYTAVGKEAGHLQLDVSTQGGAMNSATGM